MSNTIPTDQEWKDYLAEIDRMRAELAAVSQCYKSLVDTEIRLRAELAMYKTDGAMVRELNRLRTENEALRKQLMNNSTSAARDGGQKPD